MDDLQAIISTLNKEEHKQFRQFLLRKRLPKNRKDIELFNLFSGTEIIEKDAIFEKLYSKKAELNAYHSLRKRLYKSLHDFIYLRQHESSSVRNINKSITVIGYYFNHNLENLAWKDLRKIEQQAQKEEDYLALKRIYSLALSNYKKEFAHVNIDQLLENHQHASKLVQDEENLKLIASVVKTELRTIIRSGKDMDLQRLVKRLLLKFDLEERVYRHPKLLYSFILLMRDVMLSQKRYHEFEPFLMANLRLLEQQDYFNNRPYYGTNIFYIAAHTLYRNKKFNEAILYLNKMEENLAAVNKGAYQKFYPKHELLLAACYNYTGRLEEAIEILEELRKLNWLGQEIVANTQLNLAVYIFQKMAYKEAVKQLLQLDHTDNWYEKTMGSEWILKKRMVEVFFQYEIENYDLAYDLINAIERRYKKLLQQEKYHRVVTFLRLIKQIIQQPSIIGSEAFMQQIDHSFEWKTIVEEDLQAMGYYAWLKSKNIQESYYQTQLNLVKES